MFGSKLATKITWETTMTFQKNNYNRPFAPIYSVGSGKRTAPTHSTAFNDEERPAGGFVARALRRTNVLLAGLLCLTGAEAAKAFTIFDYQIPITAFADIQANPNDHLRWDLTRPITYSFDAKFNALFTDPKIKDQIRLALAAWANVNSIGYGPTPGYGNTDILEANAFGDIRSITLHELGHALGLGHPNQGAAADLNFIFNPDGGDPSTETLTKVNSSQAPNSANTEVMYAFFSSGEYRRILTWDEIDGFYKLYGTQSPRFQEVASGGDLVFTTWNATDQFGNPNPLNFALTAVSGTQGNATTGSTITSATISYNAISSTSMGFQTHGINWSCYNNILKVHSIKIRTHGTDSTTPVTSRNGPAYWDNQGTSYVLNSGGPPTGLSAASSGLKDDVIWTWTLPGATAATDVPINTIFHPGLSVDANNWSVANSQCYDINGISSTLPLTVDHSFYTDGLLGFASLNRRSHADSEQDAQAATYYARAGSNICAQGFMIVPTDAPQTTIANLQFAEVTGMGIAISNLNAQGFAQLQASNLVTTVTNFGVHTLGPGQPFVVLLQGGAGCLPYDVVTNGNYIVLNRPDLLTKEVFLAWQSSNPENTVGNYSLMGEPPVVNLPVLTISINNHLPTNNVTLTWPSPSTGYVLQQSPSVTASNWVTVAAAPMNVLSPTLGIYQNQVALTSHTNQIFYRLVKN
jgi:hypothetical protein